jgi:hypothetical protein
MPLKEHVFKRIDKPMTWTRAIVLGILIWVFAILALGQLPSLIIYKFDQYVAEIIEFSGKLPLIPDQGLNTTQVRIVRDLVANGVQMTILIAMLAVAYFWQKAKHKRLGTKDLSDPVKGYLPGK